MTFRGTQADINARARTALAFTPGAGYAGPATSSSLSSDLGNSGRRRTRWAIGTCCWSTSRRTRPTPRRCVVSPGNQTDARRDAARLVHAERQRDLGQRRCRRHSDRGHAHRDRRHADPFDQHRARIPGEHDVLERSAAARGAMTPSGDYILVWQSGGQDGTGIGIYGQRYNAEGIALAPEFRVNTTPRATRAVRRSRPTARAISSSSGRPRARTRTGGASTASASARAAPRSAASSG